MIKQAKGNLLHARADALVNTVNSEGVMGKGIALQFKRAFPSMFDEYVRACKAGEVQAGRMHVVRVEHLTDGPKWVINFPTKKHWKARSRLEDIETGLADLVRLVRELGIASIAVPPLGCGHGGLLWKDVYPLIERAFANEPATAYVYAPDGAPRAQEMIDRTAAPKMTVGRAALIALIDRYAAGLLDPLVSLLEIHKLMYFLQESGQPLRLDYSAQRYGPYASNLRQVLIKLEGHWLSGYGAGDDLPKKPIELKGNAVDDARSFLSEHHDVLERMDRVGELIAGFEDAYGMELLSSMHWVMCRDKQARDNVDVAITHVHAWNERKKAVLKPQHLRAAWERLRELRWHIDTRSALH